MVLEKGFFMSEHPLQAFISLINFDQSTYLLEEQINEVNSEIQALQKDQLVLLQEVELLKQKVHDAQKRVDSSELEMKSLEEKEKKRKKDLEYVSNQKEYKAITTEINDLKQQQHEYEEYLLDAWNKLENLKSDLTNKTKSHDVKKQELENQIEDKQKKIEEIKSSLQERQLSREDKTKTIPVELLDKYVAMRSKVSDPVVPVIRNSCSSCFCHLSPQDLSQVKKRHILQCKGCYRFLYFQSEEQ